MKQTGTLLLALAALASGHAASAKDIQIQENSSGLAAEQSVNIARTAVSMGVKEPLILRKSADGVSVSGAGTTACNIKLSADAKILGVSCK